MKSHYSILVLVTCIALPGLACGGPRNSPTDGLKIAVCGVGPIEREGDPEVDSTYAADLALAHFRFGLKNLGDEVLRDVELEMEVTRRDGTSEEFFSGLIGEWKPNEVETFERPGPFERPGAFERSDDWERIVISMRIDREKIHYVIYELPGNLLSDTAILRPRE